MRYPCERCGEAEAVPKEKYCKRCRKAVKREMIDDGYLRPTGDVHAGQRRTRDAKERTHETKFGRQT